MAKISEMFPENFGAIKKAVFVRDNNVKYEVLSLNYGLCFCKIKIVDDRFESETLFVASASLRQF